jgi:hypothetical protein
MLTIVLGETEARVELQEGARLYQDKVPYADLELVVLDQGQWRYIKGPRAWLVTLMGLKQLEGVELVMKREG